MAQFESKTRVRLSDTDAQGVVYYGRYYDYFDVSRLEMCRRVGVTVSALGKRGLMFVAAESACTYEGSAKFDDELTLRVGISRLGRSSVTYAHSILRGKRILARGTVVDVMVDDKGEPSLIPEDVRKKLSRFSTEVTTPRGGSRGLQSRPRA
ncbi:MAG TPA: thioesterase family protein [Nitrososphaerales archaeon]|nr:thioesterase family protein [Nitrososphaerales archaeon]